MHMTNGERSLAIFVDFENLALGFQGRRDRFDIARVLERLVEKGKVVAKKAYADWSRFGPYTAPLHEAAIELVEIPRRVQTGKNSADIRLCVDAMDLAYSKEHIDTFVIVSGDSDFSPLVSKLKENGKHVIGLGMQESTSDLLRDNCDEFIYYEDLGKVPTLTPDVSPQLPENKRKAFELLLEAAADRPVPPPEEGGPAEAFADLEPEPTPQRREPRGRRRERPAKEPRPKAAPAEPAPAEPAPPPAPVPPPPAEEDEFAP